MKPHTMPSGAVIAVTPFDINISGGLVRIYRYPQEFENRIHGQVLVKTINGGKVGKIPATTGLYRVVECLTKRDCDGNKVTPKSGFAPHILIIGKIAEAFIDIYEAIESMWPGRLGELQRQREAALAAWPVR